MNSRPFRFLILMILLLSLLFVYPQAHGGAAQIDPTIRVWLRRLQITDVLRIDVQGSYMLDDESMSFSDGAALTVALRGDQLVLHTDAMAVRMGSEIILKRCIGEQPSSLRLNDSTGVYEGDLHLSVQDGVILPILHIYVEDYLLGVVPYEMGDSFPLEALKAQAIAARTYALKKRDSSQDEKYDVEDTTNDQAYKGRSASSPLSEQAVFETTGLCGTYKNKLAWCYYSASNGGQTELGQHVWPTADPDAYAYMDMRDDPYDYENGDSTVKRFTLTKKPGKKGIGDALHAALTDALKEPLSKLGYPDVDENLLRFDEILSVSAINPQYEEPSRLMTTLEFTLKVSVREYTYKDTYSELEPIADSAQAEPTPTPAPTATPAYSPYKKLKSAFTVQLPIFTEAERAMGLSINIKPNELISVFDIGSAYMIESRRFGHGVGMSQRGAEQMAERYDMSCQDILEFYYPGMDTVFFDMQREPMPVVDMTIMATPAPTPSPTPRPTHMPVTKENMPRGAYLAVVNVESDSSLNLRKDPSLSSDVLRRLYSDQELIVLSKHDNGWVKVKTDVIEGYVKQEFLETTKSK